MNFGKKFNFFENFQNNFLFFLFFVERNVQLAARLQQKEADLNEARKDLEEVAKEKENLREKVTQLEEKILMAPALSPVIRKKHESGQDFKKGKSTQSRNLGIFLQFRFYVKSCFSEI